MMTYVSFDLVVLAMKPTADPQSAQAMLERCNDIARHPEGDIDHRVTAFAHAADDSAWMSEPEIASDHVKMHLSWGSRSDLLIEAIQELASQKGLVLVDLQSNDVYLLSPPGTAD